MKKALNVFAVDKIKIKDVAKAKVDAAQIRAREELRMFFKENKDRVFYSRQIEVKNERNFFHWITNRALWDLINEGFLISEEMGLRWGYNVHVIRHHSFRYYKREAAQLRDLVEEYSDPYIGDMIGAHCEDMVLKGFARFEFVLKGQHTREYKGKTWTKTKHNIDMIFERDAIGYGIEVKNTLGYMNQYELRTKMELCKYLSLRHVFAVRMLPKSWIYNIRNDDGYAMILGYQLYPQEFKELAERIKNKLGLPVDTPRELQDGTMNRFMNWHRKHVN